MKYLSFGFIALLHFNSCLPSEYATEPRRKSDLWSVKYDLVKKEAVYFLKSRYAEIYAHETTQLTVINQELREINADLGKDNKRLSQENEDLKKINNDLLEQVKILQEQLQKKNFLEQFRQHKASLSNGVAENKITVIIHQPPISQKKVSFAKEEDAADT